MREALTTTGSPPYDAIVIGAGICGRRLPALRPRGRARCLALDRQEAVGGLWNRLPAWQDIQNRRDDFAIGDVPLRGVRQADVAEFVRAWVREHRLGDSIRLGYEVTSAARTDGRWCVQTDGGTFEAVCLVVASGTQNRPWIPEVERSSSGVLEYRSSELQRPQELAGRDVTVVGGGASAWDLLDLALEHRARRVRWVYRKPRWFLPTTRPKQRAWPNLRELAVVQSVAGSSRIVSAFLQGLLRREYDHFRLGGIEPDEPFDVRRHMLIPGRSRILRELDRLSRHRSSVRSVDGRTVTLASGERFETDVILWGTGYRMDLAYLGLPEYRHVEAHDQLLPRLGSLVRSVDHPNLFFVGMTLSESTSSTPFFAAVESRTIAAYITGRCETPEQTVPHQIPHWDLFRHFGRFDRAELRPAVVAGDVLPARLVVRGAAAPARQGLRSAPSGEQLVGFDHRVDFDLRVDAGARDDAQLGGSLPGYVSAVLGQRGARSSERAHAFCRSAANPLSCSVTYGSSSMTTTTGRSAIAPATAARSAADQIDEPALSRMTAADRATFPRARARGPRCNRPPGTRG